METNYKSYIDNIRKLEKDVRNSKQEYKKKAQSDIVDAFSKYFHHKTLDEVNIDVSNKGQFLNDLFFLNDDYGLIFHISENDWEWFTITTKIIYRNIKLDKFMISSTLHTFLPINNENPLKIAERTYDDMKIRNEKRIKNKKKRKFNKELKKFNL